MPAAGGACRDWSANVQHGTATFVGGVSAREARIWARILTLPRGMRRATAPPFVRIQTFGALVTCLAMSRCGGHVEGDGGPVHATTDAGTGQTFTIYNGNIDKVDILFDIDNSASMADKQDYLKAAIPDLVNRLINPNCVDAYGVSHGPSVNGTCANSADKPEFRPVHDLHIGIVSSSLGARGGDTCGAGAMALPPYSNVSAHNDDQAHLLNRNLTYAAGGGTVTEGSVADAPALDPYLYWVPAAQNISQTPGMGNALSNIPATQLIEDFADMVGGTGVFGCGIQSPLESWYRFLVQPDPYASVVLDGQGRAGWSGVDTTILQQRHDFLRPDSMVVVVVVSGSGDKEIDVRSLGGRGYQWLSSTFTPPRATSSCATNPASASCQPCGQPGTASDPACTGPASPDPWLDQLDLRYAHMKEKYGVDVQFPLQRYVNGLTSAAVPNRSGEYPTGATSYVGMNNCQNPLFAAVLPDGSKTDPDTLCHATPGSRTKGLVYYVHIGGVPSSLLHFTPGDAVASTLSSDDWTKILGRDPLHYDFTGIDQHMIESDVPRQGVAPPGSANNTDPVNGHDWVTRVGTHADLEYACIFPLSDANGNAVSRDCTLAQNTNFCDCPHMAGSLNAMQLPPICDATTITKQVGSRVYPTTRELLLAKELNHQAAVASMCPINLQDNATGDDPLYGYRPAFAPLIDRLKPALTNLCLPEAPKVDPKTNLASCTVLVELPDGPGTCAKPTCDASLGLSVPPATVLASTCSALHREYLAQVADRGSATGITDASLRSVCELGELTPPSSFIGGTCASSPDPGWCYVTGSAAGRCRQAVVFTASALPAHAVARVSCTN
jgi:hypothetical protein